MSDITSSIQTVGLCSVGLIGSAILLWCLWKTFSFVGFPIGKMITRICSDIDDNAARFLATLLGGFMCYGLMFYNAANQIEFPTNINPGEEPYDIGFWVVKLLLVTCNEVVAVLAILSGVVKVLGLDGGKEVADDFEKDVGRMA
jgi:hypothetical protein